MDLSSLPPVSPGRAPAPPRPAATESERNADAVTTDPQPDPSVLRAKEESDEGTISAPAAEREAVERLVEEADRELRMTSERLGFQVHEGSGQLLVQVVDRNTGEVIRESPPSEFLDLVVRMREMVGIFLDETT
jgi:flagellar protein FlaG